MNKKLKLFFTLSFISLAFFASAQTEICDNGIDDDGDGFIDCYDGDCADRPGATGINRGACSDFFFGNVVECADDIDVNSFAIRLQWASEDRSANSHATPMVGDLDGNGIPEVVVTNKQRRSLFILNGATGATLFSNDNLGFQPENVPVIGDINRDEFAEILVSQDQGDDLALLDHEANVIWTAKSSRNDAIGLPGFADFDEDGDVEIYYRNEVVDASTGNVLIAGTNSDWERNFTHGSLAVDVLDDAACADCDGLELISGNEVYSINEAAGTRTLVRDMDDIIHADIDPNLNYYPKYFSNWDDQWSSVSAADYNLDGHMDLIITGALGTSSETFRGETTIFFWDVFNENVITFHDPSNNFVRGPGRVNIGDVDGDGQLNANFVMNQKLYSLDENFNIHWIRPIKEGSSGFTGCSLFDFDGDGAVEVTYRSEESLLIIDGIGNGDNTTNIRREVACVSRTQEEYPVIADVDGDGASEICVTCYSNNSTPFSPYSNTEFAQVRVYESDGESWMPARSVWNQHAYYNVNINDDLTIPIEVQDHTRIFSDAGTCEYADGSIVPFASRPLNTFINQAPILNEDGCVEFASPDIEFVGILNATDAECPDATIEVTYEIRNIGDIAISGNLPVSYYSGDPRLATGSMLLDTEVTTLVNFEPETTLEITQTITGIGGNFELFVVINDNGSNPPITVPLPTSTIPECDTENNIQSTSVGFARFDLFSETLENKRKCDPAIPDNGSARAYYFGVVPGQNGTIWAENFEDRSISDKSDTDETAWTSDPGTQNPNFYGVADYNGSQMFNAVRTGGANDNGEVTWTSQAIDISNHTDVFVTLDLFESGNQESSGRWRDYIIATYELRDNTNTVTASGELTNGRQFGNFDYAQALLTGINNAGQGDSLITITVTIHNTSGAELHYLDNVSVQGTPIPVPSEQTEADGFVFNWFNLGDTTNVIHTGSSISQLAEGQYIVEGFYGATLCFSALDTVTITRESPDVNVWAYEVSPQTQCVDPNGAAFAFAYTQTQDGTFPASELNPPLDTLLEADGYQVTWTLDGDLFNTVIGIGNLLEDRQGPLTYRARITDQFTGCEGETTVLITSTAEDVEGLTANRVNINTCGGTGEVSALVNGTIVGYTFDWYDGAAIKPAADFTGDVYTVNDPGSYTVVATDDNTGCTSEPVTVVVEDEANAPVLVGVEVQPNTTCGSNPTGIAQAEVNGSVGQSGFTYTWFEGTNTLPANELPDPGNSPAAFGVGEWELRNLTAGIYTIIVEETATNCTDTTTVTISDAIVTPTIVEADVDLTANTSCDPLNPNGLINASVAITPASSYTYSLYRGFVVDAGNLVETNTSGSFASLAADSYTISAIDQTTQCVAAAVTVTVPDQPDNPIITTNPIADEFCIGGNGQIEVTSSSSVAEPGSYTYEIFEGFSFANEITAISNITVSDGTAGYTFMGLADGNYRIRVTNDNLDCTSFEDVVVGDNSVIPTISASRLVNPNSSCDPLAPNGTIAISVDEVGFDATNYNWEWYQGSSVDPSFLLANPETGEGGSVTINGYTITNNSVIGLAAGDYTVFARDLQTGCKTVDLTLTVTDEPNPINVNTAVISPQTFCDEGNGSVSASVDGTVLGLPCNQCVGSDGFTFEWFFGNDTSNPLDDADLGGNGTLAFNSDNTQVNGLVACNYTVRARETSTQCFSTQTITVNTDFNFPDPDAVTTPNTVCDDTSPLVNFDGTITVTATDDSGPIDFSLGQFEIALYEGVGTTGASTTQTNNTTFDQLEDGSYTVVITNTISGCSSNPETYVVDRSITDFSADINAIAIDQISCDLTNPLGQVVADVAGSTSGYTFQLFLGAAEITTNVVDNSPGDITFDQLASGSYRLVVTSETSGCAYDETVVVGSNQVDPQFDNQSTVPNARCTGPDGIISFDINAGAGADARAGANYLAELFLGTSITPTSTSIDDNTLAGPNASFSFTGLSDDDYIIRVTDLTTGCEITELFTVIYDGPEIIIDETAIVRGFPTDCFSSGGSIDITNAITIDNPDASSISVEWFIGGDTLPANALPTGGLFAGTTILNGTGSVNTTNPGGTASATGLILDVIPAISYTALIRLNNGCVETVNVSLPEADPPTVTFTPTDPTDCSPSDGSIQIDIQTNAATIGDIADNYQFTLFSGVQNVGADSNPGSPYDPSIPSGDEVPLTNFNSGTNADSETINNLESGTYTVIVRRDPVSPISADECPVGVLTFTLQEPPSPVLDNFNSVNNTNCADGADGGIEYNGTFSLTSTYNGGAEDMDFGLYLFDGTNFIFVADNGSPTANSVNGDDDFDVVLDPDLDNNGTDDDLSITGLGELPAGLNFAVIAESANAVGCQDTIFFDIFNDPTVIAVAGSATDIEDCNGPNELGNFIVDTYPGADTELNYVFTWLDETGTPEAPVSGAGSGSRDYTTDGNYYVIVRSLSNGCETQIDFTINDNTDDPVVVISQDANDTHCEPSTGTGGLTASVVTGAFDANDYIFTWYQGSSVDPDSVLANPEAGEGADVTANGYIIGGTNGEVISNLPDGLYTVSVIDDAGNDLGCESMLVSSVAELQEIPTLAGIQASPDSLCNLPTSGQFVIEDTDFSLGVITDYTITVERGSLGSGVFVAGDFGTPGEVTYDNLEADSYFITAIKNASAIPSENTGCSIAPVRVDIEDISTLPLVTLERVVSDQNCGAGATNAGLLEVLVDGQYDHTTPRYTFFWEIAGGGALPVAVADNEATLRDVPEGSYQVTVTNTNTGCSVVREYDVPNTIVLPNITASSVNPITNCTPDNGSYELVEVTYDGVVYTDGGANDLNGAFELEVRLSSDNSLVNGIVNASPFLLQNLAADDYYAQVRHITTSCLSEPFDFAITNEAVLPLVVLSLDAADSTCQAGFTPNGTVSTTVTGGPITDFSFQWYFGAAADIGGSAILLDGTPLANGSVPVGFDQATISGLAAGTYSVQVSQASNGCVVSEEIIVPNVPAEVEIISTNVTSSSNCFGNGGIEITGVTKNGLDDNLANYVFDFYTVDPNDAGATPVFTTDAISGPVFDAAMGNTTYFIVGRQTVVGCETPVVQVTVPENLVYPEIILAAFETQSNCDPNNPDGSLTVLADSLPENATYDFTWYFGTGTTNLLDATDYQGGTNLSGEATNAVSGLAAGFYTVEVFNTVTGCSSIETYEMVDDTPDELALTTSVSPNTSCTEPNGRVAASVLNPARDEITGEFRQYEYYWYLTQAAAQNDLDNNITTNAIRVGSSIENLANATYWVFAVDATDNFCNSVIEPAEVLNEINPPAFSLETRDVAVCFDDKDGFAELIIDDLSSVTVTWLNDQNDSLGTGFFIDSLDAGLYTARVVNNITQCPAEQVFEIINNAVTPNDPFVLVNNVRTNCSVPNGSAIANVDGITNNFLFEWFDPVDMSNPYAVGSQVTNLDSITYIVRATNILTGCDSETEVSIGWEQIDPVFEVVIDNSICLRTEDGATNQFTGSAFLQFEEFNLPEVIEWSFITRNDAGEIIGRELVSTDARLIDAFPGEYEVRVVPENGCEYFDLFNIDVTLNVYNGVSANGDGKNDFFLIDCIDYFPSNNVKIFNRAGQRIFEIDSYDNRDNRFEGVSNVGGGGLVLPAGTYFYLVDLGTGEDPIQGYLELVR